MTDSTSKNALEPKLSDGERYWTPYEQADRLLDELREVMSMLERSEFVNAYMAVKRTRHNAISLWSSLRPEGDDV